MLNNKTISAINLMSVIVIMTPWAGVMSFLPSSAWRRACRDWSRAYILYIQILPEIFVHFIYFSISNTFADKVPHCNLPRENIEFSVIN